MSYKMAGGHVVTGAHFIEMVEDGSEQGCNTLKSRYLPPHKMTKTRWSVLRKAFPRLHGFRIQ
jgi:hypothetical protein